MLDALEKHVSLSPASGSARLLSGGGCQSELSTFVSRGVADAMVLDGTWVKKVWFSNVQ